MVNRLSLKKIIGRNKSKKHKMIRAHAEKLDEFKIKLEEMKKKLRLDELKEVDEDISQLLKMLLEEFSAVNDEIQERGERLREKLMKTGKIAIGGLSLAGGCLMAARALNSPFVALTGTIISLITAIKTFSDLIALRKYEKSEWEPRIAYMEELIQLISKTEGLRNAILLSYLTGFDYSNN